MAKLVELAHESPANTGSAEHVHVASTSRFRLQRIARKAHRHFGLTVHEFPSKYSGGDCLDPVHAVGSWHYHLKRAPQIADQLRAIAHRCTCRNLALDVFGDLAKEHAFFNWVRDRYGMPSAWYVGWNGERGIAQTGKRSDRLDAGAKIEKAR